MVEFPFYDRRIDFHIHTRYMLNSTRHWQPLVNGYSDHIPEDFRSAASVLATFPSQASFDLMRKRRVRYLTIHREPLRPRGLAADRAPARSVQAAPAAARRRRRRPGV